ncbi:MAG TPA: hypothetical protein VNQ90_17735 [Chthoniobacteraceae bacterium]|nr:hypothetical protein [Chthoniobacteraceae bacterium]
MDAIERAKHAQRVVNAYRRVFGSEEGKLVLEDLRGKFGTDKPAFIPKPDGGFDPLWAAVRDGQRQVVIHVEHQMSLPAQGDGNVEEPQTKVIK